VNDEWSDPVYCGDEVNRYPGVDGATAPDDTTIIFLRSSMAYIGYYNDSTKEYDNVRDFQNEGLNFASSRGITTLPDFYKVYEMNPQPDTTLDGSHYLKEDLSVYYKEENSKYYTSPYVLNISYQADTLYFSGEYTARYQGFPTITGDGKTLFYVAGYHTQRTVYVSHMLIDENGTPVSVNYNNPGVPAGFKLYAPYPNPFNPTTTIKYSIPFVGTSRDWSVQLKIYNLLGQEIETLVNEQQTAGTYEAQWNASNYASGVYLAALYTPSGLSVQKIIYLK
jgi:hypothetical protein